MTLISVSITDVTSNVAEVHTAQTHLSVPKEDMWRRPTPRRGWISLGRICDGLVYSRDSIWNDISFHAVHVTDDLRSLWEEEILMGGNRATTEIAE